MERPGGEAGDVALYAGATLDPSRLWRRLPPVQGNLTRKAPGANMAQNV